MLLRKRLQKHQRMPELIAKLLDLLNIFLVNLVRDICTTGDLVDIVGNVIGDAGEFFQLVFVDLSDVSLKNHRTNKSTETAHTAVLKLLLDSRHFFGADTDFQVQCTLLFIFHFLLFSFSVFLNSGS